MSQVMHMNFFCMWFFFLIERVSNKKRIRKRMFPLLVCLLFNLFLCIMCCAVYIYIYMYVFNTFFLNKNVKNDYKVCIFYLFFSALLTIVLVFFYFNRNLIFFCPHHGSPWLVKSFKVLMLAEILENNNQSHCCSCYFLWFCY